jgi:hypothetical protein
MLVEDGQRPPANTPGNNHLDPHFPQPARERPRLMLRCREHRGVKGALLLEVDLDHGKLAAASEMVVQTSVFNWNCDLHRCSFCGSIGRITAGDNQSFQVMPSSLWLSSSAWASGRPAGGEGGGNTRRSGATPSSRACGNPLAANGRRETPPTRSRRPRTDAAGPARRALPTSGEATPTRRHRAGRPPSAPQYCGPSHSPAEG